MSAFCVVHVRWQALGSAEAITNARVCALFQSHLEALKVTDASQGLLAFLSLVSVMFCVLCGVCAALLVAWLFCQTADRVL